MKTMIKSITILTVTLLYGCAGPVYHKLGATQEAFAADQQACLFYLQTHGDNIPWPHLMKSCMLTKGYAS